jgi:hypothetical protein
MKNARPQSNRGWLVGVLLAAALGAGTAAQQMVPATRVDQKPTVSDASLALWAKGEFASALAAFEKSIAADAGNLALHARFARTVAGARWKTTELEQERKRAAAEKEKPAVPPTPVAAGDKPAAAASYKPPPVKTNEELAAMAKTAEAAAAALADLTARYERWMKERPASAAYPYALALLVDPKDEARREKLLLAAAALDPKLVEPYTELIALHTGYDDEAALKYARKALALKPDDVPSQLTCARMLWPVDQDAGRRYYAELLAKYAGTRDGASTIQQFIGAVEDPAERAALVERFRREYPNDWTPAYFGNVDLFGITVSVDPQKGLAFAREMLTAVENPAPGADGKTRSPEAYLKTLWTRNLGYAQAVVDARALIAGGKGAEALARLEKETVPNSVDDEAQLEVLRAEATAASGDAVKAYDQLVTSLAADITPSAQKAIVGFGAKLGKSPKQIDDEVWARRMQKAETFAAFDLAKLGSQERVKLADLRGKVVLVDFWFPG